MLKSSKGIQPSNNTDALFRAWSQFIFDGMIAGGWVQTADTGQINFATVTRPTIANNARGYVILRMDDALQATVPVYLRLDFGSGGAANNMGLWVTLGAASDGAGAITNPWLSNPTSAQPLVSSLSNSTSLVQPYSFLSADNDRVQIAIAYNAAGAVGMIMSLERTHSPSGAHDGTGVIFYYGAASASFNRNQYLFAADLPQPPVENGFVAILPIRNVSVTSQNWGIGIPIPFAGLAQQPGSDVLVTQTNDALKYGRFGIDIYGRRVVYQAMFDGRVTGFGHDGTSIILLRAD